MKKINIILIILISIIASLQFITAEASISNVFREATIDSNGNVIETQTPVNNVDVLGFVCADASCSTVSSTLWNGNVLNSGDDQITLVYPTVLQSPHGYGIYMYKDGYITWELTANWAGSGSAGPFNNYLTKKQSCTARVDNIFVSSSDQTINIEADIASPLQTSGELNYIPSQLQNHYSTTIDVTLEIRDPQGNLINTQTQQNSLEFSEQQQVDFSVPVSPGDYTVQVYTNLENEEKCLDYTTSSRQDTITITEPDTTPQITSISATPQTGFIPLEVEFNCQAIAGNGILSYEWNFGDGSTSSLQNPIYTYDSLGGYTATCTVTDEDSDQDQDSIIINAVQNTLEITKLNCFENIIENNNQSCSIFVENSLNLPEPEVTVDIYYSDDTLFGTCTTDAISGGCMVKDFQQTIGEKTVYAVASKDYFSSDEDNLPTFTYTVLEEVYDITELTIYGGDLFLNQDDDFFRGENLYVKFRVTLSGNPIEDMITQATLVSLPGGRVDLTQMNNSDGWYYYELVPIPTTHEFFGDSNIFSFAFNFTDGSGGQSEVALIIRNNPPTIDLIPSQSVRLRSTISVDLSEYENDVEDSSDDLTWEIIGTNEFVETSLIGKTLAIKGIQRGQTTILLRLFDLNNHSVEQEVNITVTRRSSGGGGGGSITTHAIITEETPSSTGIGSFVIPPETQEEITEPSAFMKFLLSGKGAALIMSLLVLLISLGIIIIIAT